MTAPSTITTGAVIGRLLTANPVATSVGIRINTRMESRSFMAELLAWCVRAQERTPYWRPQERSTQELLTRQTQPRGTNKFLLMQAFSFAVPHAVTALTQLRDE